MRVLPTTLSLFLPVSLLIVAACKSATDDPGAICLARHFVPGTWAYEDCVEKVEARGPLILRHGHRGDHQ